jgi:acetyl esterase/lipase
MAAHPELSNMPTLRKSLLGAGLALGLALAPVSSARAAPRVVRDVTFAKVDQSELKLDLYLPPAAPGAAAPVGLIVWVHGGGWRAGSRASVEVVGLVDRGWAIASVDYRLSPVARFPAQVHDIKAAIRFLRAHAAQYGYPASRVVVAGSSAGAHLAALVGVSNRERELEGSVGADTAQSSDVQAIVSLFGASNLTTILAQSTPYGLDVRAPALELLLGGQPESVPELARLASPVFHVDATDPPLLLLHGDQDKQMPINQSHELQGAYEKLGLPVRFEVVHGSGHGGPDFTSDARLARIDDFLRQQLKLPRGTAPSPAPGEPAGPAEAAK